MKIERAGRLFIWQNCVRLRQPHMGENSRNNLFPPPFPNLTKQGQSIISESLLIRMEEEDLGVHVKEAHRHAWMTSNSALWLREHYRLSGKFIIWISLQFLGSMWPFSVWLITSLLVLELSLWIPVSLQMCDASDPGLTNPIHLFFLPPDCHYHSSHNTHGRRKKKSRREVSKSEKKQRRENKMGFNDRILCRSGPKPSCL